MKLKGVLFYRMVDLFGTDTVPGDMLRYDLAFVNDKVPGVVAFPKFASKHGIVGGRPTHGRWDSFAIKLTLITGELPVFSDAWYTYGHPRKEPYGPTDYSRLEKITLDKCLQVKNVTDL